jgi:hypothetical protein
VIHEFHVDSLCENASHHKTEGYCCPVAFARRDVLNGQPEAPHMDTKNAKGNQR